MRYAGPIIDADVHHAWPSQDDVVGYLPKRWQRFMADHGTPPLALKPPTNSIQSITGTNKRAESFPPGGGPPGSDYAWLKKQHLDPNRIAACVLAYDPGYEGSRRNPELSVAISRAVNDWNADTWLSLPDKRLRSTPVIPSELPEAAAAEIRRVAQNERIAEILLVANPNFKPYGHPFYHPIYEAAVELDLPVAMHVPGADPIVVNQAGGIPSSRIEWLTHLGQAAHHYVSSMIVNGVFERYPQLRVLLVEWGVAWLPWLMWTLDEQYERMQAASTWVRRWPSEYIRDHVRFTVQPLETGSSGSELMSVLTAIDGIEDLLCFSTDYPHWDADDPAYVASQLPAEWHDKVFYINGRKLYGSRLSLPSHPLAAEDEMHVA